MFLLRMILAECEINEKSKVYESKGKTAGKMKIINQVFLFDAGKGKTKRANEQ